MAAMDFGDPEEIEVGAPIGSQRIERCVAKAMDRKINKNVCE
jgi:hypothetical protein